MKCSKRYRKILGIFKIKEPHLFLFTNAFSTLELLDKWDIVKTCQACGEKQVIEMDFETLLEVSALYPKAFNDTLKEYLNSWNV